MHTWTIVESLERNLKDKSPLIREQFNIDNPFTAGAPKFVSYRMMSLIFEDVLKRSGVNQDQGRNERRDVMTTHGFRKFFINQCEKVNLNYTTWKYLAGHKLRKTDASYNGDGGGYAYRICQSNPITHYRSNSKVREENRGERDNRLKRLPT